MDKGLLILKGAVQHYEWGGRDFIPELIGATNTERRPFAELWIGAHAKAPAVAQLDGVETPLDRLIASAPDELLGLEASRRFGGSLPYLFKVLDARQMLSIQAHPTRAQAVEGFARENSAGIGLQAANRNYKDDNHKPEVHVALTEFWMLHGFRPLEEIGATLAAVPELNAIMPDFAQRLSRACQDTPASRELLRELYGAIMTMPQQRVDLLLNALLARLQRATTRDKSKAGYWALRASDDFPLPGGHRDRGIFSIYLLNLVHLRPGQGTFQPAGVLHAYLEGVNIELMASSDNVLRGGLTPKHVDVPELMRTLSFDTGEPQVLDGEPVSAYERVYRTSAEEFELSRVDLPAGGRCQCRASHGPDSLIVTAGCVSVQAAERTISLKRGDIAFAPHGLNYSLESAAGPAQIFKAAVPAP